MLHFGGVMKEYLTRAALICCSVLFVIFLIELALRAAAGFTTLSDEKCYVPSDVPGLKHIANTGFSRPHFRINSNHLRDSEIPIEKPPETFRIAVVGNSVTIGHRIAQEDLFTEVMETDFNSVFQGNPHVDVINAGQADYNISNFMPFSRRYVYIYQPDIICYQFSWNDIAVPQRLALYLPESRRTEYGHKETILLKSYLYAQLYKLSRFEPVVSRLMDYYSNEDLLNDFYADLFSWAEEVQRLNMRFIIFIFPPSVEVHKADEYPDICNQFVRHRTRLIEQCRSRGLEVYDLTAGLRDQFLSGGRKLYLDQGHLNARGHRGAAKIMEDHLMPYISEGGSLKANVYGELEP